MSEDLAICSLRVFAADNVGAPYIGVATEICIVFLLILLKLRISLVRPSRKGNYGNNNLPLFDLFETGKKLYLKFLVCINDSKILHKQSF